MSFSPVVHLHLDGGGAVCHDLADLVLLGLLLLLLGTCGRGSHSGYFIFIYKLLCVSSMECVIGIMAHLTLNK